MTAKKAVAKKAPAKKAAAKKTTAKKTTEEVVETGQAPGSPHGLYQRDPNGVYLDDVNDVKAELHRAQVEGRKPKLSSFPKPAVNYVLPTKD